MSITAHYQLTVGKDFFDEMSNRSAEHPGEVVMVVRRMDDHILLSTKEFYPAGVYRLPTGKMKVGETPEASYEREVIEELGFSIPIDKYLGTIRCTFTFEGRSVDFDSHVFLSCATSGIPSPIDKEELITGFKEITPCELKEVADHLQKLADPWRDWGRFRAIAHKFVHKQLCST